MTDSQNDKIWILTWFTSVFLMIGAELRSFSHFQCKAVEDSQKDQIKWEDDLQVFSWWMEENWADLIIIKILPR